MRIRVRGVIRTELVGDHDAKSMAVFSKGLAPELFGRAFVTAALDQGVENRAFLIDGAPKPMLLAIDCNDDPIEMPFIAKLSSASADFVAEVSTKFLGPSANRFMADDDAARGQKVFDHSQAEKIRRQLVNVTVLTRAIGTSWEQPQSGNTSALNDGALAGSAPMSLYPRMIADHDSGVFTLANYLFNKPSGGAPGSSHATNVTRQSHSVSRETRARLKRQRPAVLWFTGLSASGKTTVANCVERMLADRHVHTILLDGDNMRLGINKDLGFSELDRIENIRRIGEVAKLMADAGLIVLCAFISPFRAERHFVRELLEAGEFVEIFVDTPLEVCIARDPKGLYKRAMSGEIKNFTGIDQAYERPENPDIILRGPGETPDEHAGRIVCDLIRRGVIDGSSDASHSN